MRQWEVGGDDVVGTLGSGGALGESCEVRTFFLGSLSVTPSSHLQIRPAHQVNLDCA